MSEPDYRAVAARIRAETGIDVLDDDANARADRLATREQLRRVGSWVVASLLGAVGLLLVIAAAAADDAVAARVAVAVVGLAGAGGAVVLGVSAFRPSRRYRNEVLPRVAARDRFVAELGDAAPGLLAQSGVLTRAAYSAFSTPKDIRKMQAERARRRHQQSQQSQKPGTEDDES
jgi:hypothetical protein